jgi:cytochrome bd-type quinol oxidase subunit 2
MKKLFTALFALLTVFAVQSVALADIAPGLRPSQVNQLFRSPIVPIILVIVIIAIVVLIRLIRKKRNESSDGNKRD